MSSEHLYIILGCFGRRDDDFVSCIGVENRILKLDTSLYLYNEMMDYVDGCRLFDRPLFDLNAIRHFVFNMQERYDQPSRKLWTEKNFNLYQKFIIDHRHCGLYIKLILVPETEDLAPEPEPSKIFVKGNESLEPSNQEVNLKLLEGRKRR